MAFPTDSTYNKFFSNNSDSSENEDNDATPLNTVYFDHFGEPEDTLLTNNKVIVFGVAAGKKKNTYIIGLEKHTNIPDVKSILEKMKKTFGCGGSIKDVQYQSKDYSALHLQGDMVKKAGKYLATLNISNIEIKELL
jgi:translation initiation factor 1 (eIF-1/SUI1)